MTVLWIALIVNQVAWLNYMLRHRAKYRRLCKAVVLRRIDASKEPGGVYVGCLKRHCSCVK